jgi:hypothetical protein
MLSRQCWGSILCGLYFHLWILGKGEMSIKKSNPIIKKKMNRIEN